MVPRLPIEKFLLEHLRMALSEEEVRQLKVVELKAELGKLGLSISGKKEELIERLLRFLTEEKMLSSPDEDETSATSTKLNEKSNKTKIDQTVELVADKKKLIPEEEKIASRAARFGMSPKSSPTPASTRLDRASEVKHEICCLSNAFKSAKNVSVLQSVVVL